MTSAQRRFLRVLRGLFFTCLGLAIVGVSVGMARHFMSNPRRPEQAPPVQEIPVVEVALAVTSDECVVLEPMGTVIPANEVSLQAQVSGRIVALHPQFMEGGILAAGETLVEIDPRDYELALATSQAQLEEAQANLKMEHGQQEVAQHEWDLLDLKDKASDLDRELALRKPYLRQMQAAVAAAEAQVAQAKLNLERTKVKAPVNAIIQTADVRVGELASSQTQLASLVGTDAYWVQASVAVDELKWLRFPGQSHDSGSPARVRSKDGSVRQGRVLKLLSDLEDFGKLARILIRVEDPLGLSAGQDDPVPLLLGEVVSVAIEGRRVEDIVALPRTALRDGSSVWLLDEENRLAIERPELVWRGDETVFCRGLTPGASIVISDLAAPVEGMTLQVLGQEARDPALAEAVAAPAADQIAAHLAPATVEAPEEGR